jgi:hypothetical protein
MFSPANALASKRGGNVKGASEPRQEGWCYPVAASTAVCSDFWRGFGEECPRSSSRITARDSLIAEAVIA